MPQVSFLAEIMLHILTAKRSTILPTVKIIIIKKKHVTYATAIMLSNLLHVSNVVPVLLGKQGDNLDRILILNLLS